MGQPGRAPTVWRALRLTSHFGLRAIGAHWQERYRSWCCVAAAAAAAALYRSWCLVVALAAASPLAQRSQLFTFRCVDSAESRHGGATAKSRHDRVLDRFGLRPCVKLGRRDVGAWRLASVAGDLRRGRKEVERHVGGALLRLARGERRSRLAALAKLDHRALDHLEVAQEVVGVLRCQLQRRDHIVVRLARGAEALILRRLHGGGEFLGRLLGGGAVLLRGHDLRERVGPLLSVDVDRGFDLRDFSVGRDFGRPEVELDRALGGGAQQRLGGIDELALRVRLGFGPSADLFLATFWGTPTANADGLDRGRRVASEGSR